MFNFRYDSVTIYDGDSSASPILGTYCGGSIPADITSSTNEMLLHFKSDDYETKQGFEIKYTSGKHKNLVCVVLKTL